jgi:hypothetical protein
VRVAFGLAAALTVAVGPGCNMNKMAVEMTAPALLDGSIALDRESDLEFARSAMPASLKTVETFLISSPENEELLFLLSRGYSSYAFAFVEMDLDKARYVGTQAQVEDLTRRAVVHYLRGAEYGWRLLDEPAVRAAAEAADVEALRRELGGLKDEQLQQLFWATYGWASAINLSQEDPEMVGALPAVEVIMEVIVSRIPDYQDGLPLAFQGVYWGSRPPMFGGDLEKSKAAFERGIATHGARNLAIPYLYARYYASQVQDRALFDRLLAQVLTADLGAHPDTRLTNEVARDGARFWAEHAEELIMAE